MSQLPEHPKAETRKYHAGGTFARSSERWEWDITEREYPAQGLLMMAATVKPFEHRWLVDEHFSGMVALRMSEGWKLISADANSAVMTRDWKPIPAVDSTPPKRVIAHAPRRRVVTPK